jgi:hypothetical protein
VVCEAIDASALLKVSWPAITPPASVQVCSKWRTRQD